MPALKIVVAPQALKGSLDAPEVGAIIAATLADALPDAQVIVTPVADGGEGTTRALVSATNGRLRAARVTSPLGAPTQATWGMLGGEAGGEPVAVIEMAAAAGLTLLSAGERDPLRATTRGVGELLIHALDAGCRSIILGLGGSATNDGGAGMAQALGARLLDADGQELPPGGAALARLDHIDTTQLDPRLAETVIRVACDVTNPLCGPQGASAIFGPQKGADVAMVAALDAALARYAEVVRRDLGRDVAQIAGAGAAGGLGAGLLAFTRAELTPGAPLVLETLHFGETLAGAALVIVAEGRLDEQTGYGKIIQAIARQAHMAGAGVLALVGAVALDDEALRLLGVDAALPLAPGPLSLDESMARTRDLLPQATLRALRLMRLGESLGWSTSRDHSPD
ncbi:MAG TPA: glycerate kinase [Ktedonobacterales bacterium]|jgi:glycerate kinase|nr:glycerate kinase [Ktedonobacterales bacterium]